MNSDEWMAPNCVNMFWVYFHPDVLYVGRYLGVRYFITHDGLYFEQNPIDGRWKETGRTYVTVL